ncbi:MAG: hypothetical protein KIT47_06645 [Rhodoferax sp.]|nr:hypothetical protein [Rhodoferax sp.]
MSYTAASHHRSVAQALARARRMVVRVQAGALLVLLLLAVVASPARGEVTERSATTVATAPETPLPQRLSETGLYGADGASGRVVGSDTLPFSPQYPLWSDGASKRRWIRLPPGTFIDASDPDAWRFPVGTRLWKEFAHAGRPIETRFIERLADGRWRFATYVWNLQGTDALLAPERGVRALPAPGAPGGLYAVPSRADCRGCHEGGPSPVLGFGALQLSPERDPQVPHAETPPPGHTDLADLQARGLLRLLPPDVARTPPRIAAGSAVARSALGYLHANCGHCHNDTGPLAAMDMALLQSVADAPGSARRTWASLYGKTSRFRADRGDRGDAGEAQRIAPGRVDDSTLLQRMASPHVMSRMPPMGVSVVDVAGLQLIRQWILDHEHLSHLKEHAP